MGFWLVELEPLFNDFIERDRSGSDVFIQIHRMWAKWYRCLAIVMNTAENVMEYFFKSIWRIMERIAWKNYIICSASGESRISVVCFKTWTACLRAKSIRDARGTDETTQAVMLDMDRFRNDCRLNVLSENKEYWRKLKEYERNICIRSTRPL